MKYFFLIWTAPIIITMTPLSGQALDWNLVLNFSIADPSAPGGAIQSRLVLGVDPLATDGFNSGLDTIAASSNIINVTFPHPEYLTDPNYVAGSEFLWRDVRGNNGSGRSWIIDAGSTRTSSIMTVAWIFTTSSSVCQHPVLTLIDQTHEEVASLTAEGSYSFPNGIDPTRLVINVDQITATPPLAPPTGFWSPRQGKNSILLSWSGQNDSDILGYTIVRRDGVQGEYRKINQEPIPAVSFLDAGLSAGTYFYKISTVNLDRCSGSDSNEISVVLN